MKKDGYYREPAVERMVEQSADGLVHLAPVQGEPLKKRNGPEPYTNKLEINICLECPLDECQLDKSEQCKRYRKELKRRKEGKK